MSWRARRAWAMAWRRLAGAAASLTLGACMATPSAPPAAPGELAVGEAREVDLYTTRLDVKDFEEVVTKADILAMPKAVRERLWLYDLDLIGRSGTPRLIDHAMAQIRAMDLHDPALSTAERNMIRLLTMTPDTADLSRTRMSELLDISPKIGFAAAEVLADAAGLGVEDPFLSNAAVTASLVDGVIGTHPNARWRPGKVTADHPDGRYPVPRGHLPVTLEDAASDMASLAHRFGPVDTPGAYHPGFLVGMTHAKVLDDDFRMTIKASTNALPFKGLDLSRAVRANVSSVGKDGASLFDFNDPDWIRIEGLVPNVTVDRMDFQILEYPEALGASTSPSPAPWGDSPVWLAPPWTLERVVAQAGLVAFAGRDYARDFYLEDPDTPLFTVRIDDGWMALSTAGNLGAPPPPMYLWDLMAEVAQVRLHDGPDPDHPAEDRIPEGQANVRFALHDVPVGVTAAQIEAAIRTNLEEDPSALVGAASSLLGQASGVPDIYYFRPREDGAGGTEDSGLGENPGDWLLYVTPQDVAEEAPDAAPETRRVYAHEGFFADAELTTKLSAPTPLAGDTAHEKLRVAPGDVLFCGDDTEGRRYRLDILPKPSRSHVRVRVTRVQ